MRSYQGIDLNLYRDQGERSNMARIHTFLQDASRALSQNVVATSMSVGAAPSNGAYLMIGNDASLSDERAIVTTSPLTATDGGANSSWTLSLTASALDHGSLGGLTDDDHTQYLLANGTRPLTNAWDAGNFAITLGSIVGKSGNLAIAPASGGNISFSTSIVSGSVGFQFTDTVARSAGGHLTVTDSTGVNRVSFGAAGPLLGTGTSMISLAHSATNIDNYNALLSVSGGNLMMTNAIKFAGLATTFAFGDGTLRYGNGGSVLWTGSLQHSYTTAALSGCGIRGMDWSSLGFTAGQGVGVKTPWGSSGSDKIIVGYWCGLLSDNSDTVGAYAAAVQVGGLLFTTRGTPGRQIPLYYGIGIGPGPVSSATDGAQAPAKAVGVWSAEDIAVPAGKKFILDGAATITNAGSIHTGNMSAYTVGDSYWLYNAGSTQVDLFVDAAQAFHFDAGGAAGTSRCYGNMQIDGTTTSTGTLAATNAATVGTTLQVTGIATFLTHARFGDNDQIQLGDAQDALIYYDGTNLLIDPDAVGTGYLGILGTLQTADVKLGTAGNGLYVKEGANATMGTTTLVAGSSVVSTTKVTASSRIFLTVNALGTVTVPTMIGVTARTAATSFTITSTNIVDTSVISWLIMEPA